MGHLLNVDDFMTYAARRGCPQLVKAAADWAVTHNALIDIRSGDPGHRRRGEVLLILYPTGPDGRTLIRQDGRNRGNPAVFITEIACDETDMGLVQGWLDAAAEKAADHALAGTIAPR